MDRRPYVGRQRTRIENGKMTSSGDGVIAEGDEKIEITSVDIEAGKTGVSANADVEISNCSVTGTNYGIYASGGTVAATACEIKSEATDTGTHAAVYSASSASITVNSGSVKGGVGAWAYTGDVTLEDVSVTSTAGDGLKAYQGTVKATGATIDSADSGAYCTDTGTVTLTSCDVTGTTYATYQSGGTLTASGGTLTGPNGCYCSNGTTNLKDSCSVTATNSEGSAAYAAGGTINATGCTLTGYYGVRQSSGSIDIENCSVTGSSYGIYISGQDTEPIIEYNDFVDCSDYAVYNSSSSRTVEAYWCYTDGKNEDSGYEDAEDRSVNVYCYPSYPESVTVSPDSREIFTGGETQTTAMASVTLKNSKLSYESQTYYTPAYSWSSSDTKVATVTGSGKTATITSVGAGTCDIICTAYDANGNAAMTVTKQVVTSISIFFDSDIIYTSNSTSTTATAAVTLNSGTYSGSCSWSVGSSYISVSGSGSSATVTANGKGTGTCGVTCSATVDGTTYSQSEDITVKTLVSSISLSNGSALYYGNGTENRTSTVTASLSYNLSGASYTENYSWSTSSSSVVTVSGNESSATLTATGSGTATITCKVDNDLVTQTLSVTVTKQQITSVSLGKPTNSTIYYGSTATTTTSNVSVSSLVANSGSISTSEATYSWSIYSGSSYVTLSNSSSVTATVTSKASGGSAALRCTVTYNGASLTSGSSSSITVTAQAITKISLKAASDTIYYGGKTENSSTTVTATVSMNNGTYNGSYSWSRYSGTSYFSLTYSSSTATVTASKAGGWATVRCQVTFNNETLYDDAKIWVEYPYVHSVTVQMNGTANTLFFLIGISYGDTTDSYTATSISSLITGLYSHYGNTTLSCSTSITSNSYTQGVFECTEFYCSSSTMYFTSTDGSVTMGLTASLVYIFGAKDSSLNGIWSYSSSCTVSRTSYDKYSLSPGLYLSDNLRYCLPAELSVNRRH